jgi:hypothetical protein
MLPNVTFLLRDETGVLYNALLPFHLFLADEDYRILKIIGVLLGHHLLET